jgi:ectoine hydroxylase
MDRDCLAAMLTDDERAAFERDGYLIVPDALSPAVVSRLASLLDVMAVERVAETEEDGRLHLRDFLLRDPAFMDLLDWPATFPKIWAMLGWHIQLYISHADITPPVAPAAEPERLGWHQDSGRVNLELETDPRPRLSVKIGYFLTDTTTPGCGNLWVLPGSHLFNAIDYPDDEIANPVGAIPVCVPPGTAVFFDRRVWHSRSPNTSGQTRKAIFYGYSYRWLRPRDNLRIEDYPAVTDPVRRQLLGAVHDGHGYSSPLPEDVPLKGWLVDALGEDAVAP